MVRAPIWGLMAGRGILDGCLDRTSPSRKRRRPHGCRSGLGWTATAFEHVCRRSHREQAMIETRYTLAALALTSALVAHATTIHVPEDHPRIQGAIWWAAEGDTVLVASGTYTGVGNRDLSFEGIDIVLLSEEGADATVIDCEGSGSAFSFGSGESPASVLDGFEIRGAHHGIKCVESSPTIRGCYLTANETGVSAGGDELPTLPGAYLTFDETGVGAAIYCESASPVLDGCTISGNAARMGGGIYCISASPSLTNCTISENWASEHGGGIYCLASSPTLTNCVISNNSAYWYGGGIYCEDSALIITDSSFAENSAALGGGIYSADSTPTITDCFFAKNSANAGGGIHSEGSSLFLLGCTLAESSAYTGAGVYGNYSDALIENCAFSTNRASSRGGGLYCYQGSTTLTKCTVAGNSSDHEGGGFFFDEYVAIELDRCSIVGNTATNGGGLYCQQGSPVLTNCILWANAAQGIVADRGSPIVTYSDVQGGWTGEGNIDVDPLFCELLCEEPDKLGLAADSPCLGAGYAGADMGAWGETCAEPPLLPEPRTLLVPADYPTIAEALTATCKDDTIVVAPGIYHELDLEIPGRGIVLESEDPLDPEVVEATVIDGGESDVISFMPSLSSGAGSIAGLTITGGGIGITCRSASPSIDRCTVSGDSTDNGRGLYCIYSSPAITHCTISGRSSGISCQNNSSPILSNTIIEGNSGYTGGISCFDHSSPILTDCAIMRNAGSGSGRGGGIRCSEFSDPTFRNCIIEENSCDGAGGGLHCSDSSAPTLIDCSIIGNSATLDGGGIYCADFCSPVLTNCTVRGCSASSDGGGLYCYRSSSPTLTNCIVGENSAQGGDGGGLYCYQNSSPTLTNCIISDNDAAGDGGGLFCYLNTYPTLTNCTLTGNSAFDQGGGLLCRASSSAALTNCILWSDTPNEIEGTATVNYCDIQGGSPGEGNIDANPGFRFARGFDYLLRPGSPCIDTGDPAIEDGISDWHPRWPDWYHDGPRSDMGAYGGPGNGGW
ncbi:MAG: hypothetical protein CME06_15700 [Gemmatimonadetes bacterium]|nr:hypothetical protein [Gemmatimonadota bacterium]